MYDVITFIGGGNMAYSLTGGLIEGGYSSEKIWVCEPEQDKCQALANQFGVQTTDNNLIGVSKANTVVLAVKPQIMQSVVSALAGAAQSQQPLIISIAAGIPEPAIRGWLGYDAAIVRVMPNTPSLLRLGVSALFANDQVGQNERERAGQILGAVGEILWVDDEALIDTVTAVSGSGPAYFFYLMELMIETGEHLGLERQAATLLTVQTALGAARMALDSGESPRTLREQVTSSGGTTQRALEILHSGGLSELVKRALTGARDRSEALGAQALSGIKER